MATQTMKLNQKLHRRSDLHISRKIWHSVTVSTMAAFYAFVPEWISLLAITAACLVLVPVDFLRLKKPDVNKRMMAVFGPIMRENEVDKLAGTTYLIFGVFLIAWVFPHHIVLLTLLFLAFADPIASYFGIRYGKDKLLGNKSLQGFVAAFVVCALLTFGFLSSHWMYMDYWIVISLLGGIIGALAELIPFGKLDDNFTLPIFSATGLWVLFEVFSKISSYTSN